MGFLHWIHCLEAISTSNKKLLVDILSTSMRSTSVVSGVSSLWSHPSAFRDRISEVNRSPDQQRQNTGGTNQNLTS